MTTEEYMKLAMRTCNPILSDRELLLAGALGLAGEAGEVADHVKKFLVQGHALDRDKVIKEAGDALWYIVVLARSQQVSLEEIMERNIAKLRERYPDGFSVERSINREE